ncbi:hypothetical protein J3F83DRAFT_727172 [Trichoderma novae-zelandiae]
MKDNRKTVVGSIRPAVTVYDQSSLQFSQSSSEIGIRNSVLGDSIGRKQQQRRRPINQTVFMTRRVIVSGRSCLECRRRKIRCDRSLPCACCTRIKLQSRYPSSPLYRDAVEGAVWRLECDPLNGLCSLWNTE